MAWEKPQGEGITVRVNGKTLDFKQVGTRENKTDGATVKVYKQTFQQKPQTKKVEQTFEPKETLKTSRQTKQETIEKMFEMSMDDLALKFNTLQLERENNQKNIATYAQCEEEMQSFLEQMIKKELYLNREVAEPLLMKYQVHLENKHYQQHLSKPKEMIEALFYIQHCHRPDIQEMIANVRNGRQENRVLGESLDEMKKEKEKLEEERQKEQEKTQQLIVNFKEKYGVLQAELKQKTIELSQFKQEKEALQKELLEMKQTLQVNDTPTVQTPIKEDKNEQATNFEEVLNYISSETDIEEIDIPDEAFMEETEEEVIEEVTPELFDFEFMEEAEAVSAIQEELPYVRLLKEKGYQIEPATSDAYDWVIAKETNEKIPLMYIYYDIEKPDEFNSMMKDTDKMYFVFDSKKRMFKGNTKFTAWLSKEKERKYNIHFSFTTVDQLKASGLSKLDNMR